MSTSGSSGDELARPAWLDGAGPSGQAVPEGFDDPEWYVDPEAARLGAARLNPEWLDLSVFASRPADPSVLSAQDPREDLEAAPGLAIERSSLESDDVGGSASTGDASSSASGSMERVREVPPPENLGDLEEDQAAGDIAGSDDAPAVAVGNLFSDSRSETGARESAPDGETELAESSSTAETTVVRVGVQDIDVLEPGAASTVDDSAEAAEAEPQGEAREDDPYRPRFTVAPKSVQVAAVLQIALAAVNVAAASVLVAVLVSSSSTIELPFAGVGLSRPVMATLVLVFSSLAVVAALSSVGVSRGEVRWWKAGLAVSLASAWAFPVALVAAMSLLRQDSKDWVI